MTRPRREGSKPVALFWPNLPFRRLTSREAERSLRRKPRRDRFERRLAISRTCLTVVHLTALQARSAVKVSRSDDIDLPEPLRRFSFSVNFAEGQVVIARSRLLVRSLGATLFSDTPCDSRPGWSSSGSCWTWGASTSQPGQTESPVQAARV